MPMEQATPERRCGFFSWCNEPRGFLVELDVGQQVWVCLRHLRQLCEGYPNPLGRPFWCLSLSGAEPETFFMDQMNWYALRDRTVPIEELGSLNWAQHDSIGYEGDTDAEVMDLARRVIARNRARWGH